MKNIALILTMLFCLAANSNASEAFLLTAEIIQNNQIIGTPKLVLPEAEEGRIEVMVDKEHDLYSLTATVVSEKENTVLVKTKLKLSKNNSLIPVGEPVFILKRGESGSIKIDHPLLGKVELKVKVIVQNHG